MTGTPSGEADLATGPGDGLGRFYVHLVAFLALQLLVIMAALALRSMAGWAGAILVVSSLALAAHAAIVLGSRRQQAQGTALESGDRVRRAGPDKAHG